MVSITIVIPIWLRTPAFSLPANEDCSPLVIYINIGDRRGAIHISLP